MIVLFTVLGFMGGVVGELWVNSFLLQDPYLSFKTYSDLSKRIDDLVANRVEKKSLNEGEAAIQSAIVKARPAIVSIYKSKNFAKNSLASLTDEDFLGMGTIITNDGWILTNDQVATSEKANYYVVTNAHQLLPAKQVIADENTSAVFLKVEANNFPVAEFVRKEELSEGQTLLAFSGSGGVFVSRIKDLNYAPLTSSVVRSSEEFYKFLMLENSFTPEYSASPLVTSDGKMAGFIADSDGRAVPMNYLLETMKATTQGQVWTRSYLGLTFIDLSEFLNPEIAETKGVLLPKDRKDGGIAADSPAKGILQTGDIIIRIEKEELSENKNLSELLSYYKPGEKLKFTVKRGGEEKELEIILK